MFGVGWAEIMVIMIVAVIVLGPKRLPEAMKQVAKIFRDIKSTVDDVKYSVMSEVDEIKALPEQAKKEFEQKLVNLEDDDLERELDKQLSKKDKPKIDNNYQPKREKISFKKEKVEDA